MGIDLKPMRPTKDAPRREDGKPVWGRYNWAGWSWFVGKLEEWGVDVSEFSGMNDGDLITAATCRKVADAIEAHLSEFPEGSVRRQEMAEDVLLWRTCGGYRQY